MATDESTLGAIVTHGDPEALGNNTVIGADFNYRNTSFRGSQNLYGHALVQDEEKLAPVLDDPTKSTVDPNRIRNVVELDERDPRNIRRKQERKLSAREMDHFVPIRQPNIVDPINQTELDEFRKAN